MARWRDMLVDYGRVLGDKSSRSSSAFFTVAGDLDDKRNADLEMRRILEVHFRPLFQRYVYGGEKIACHDLTRLLKDPEYKDRLPPEKVHELADIADFNMGKAIKYDEFVRIVMGSTQEPESEFDSDFGLSDHQAVQEPGVLAVVCRNTTTQGLVDEKALKYRCLPPPFFMIAITLAEIIVFIAYAAEEDVTTHALEGVPPGNKLMYMPTRRREAWRFLSYCLLHQGFIDLMFNVVIQLVLGIPLEIMFSWWRVMIVYTLGVITGSLGQSISDHHVGLVGASGGAYAILAGHLMQLWQNRSVLNEVRTESTTKRFLCSVALRFVVILIFIVPQIVLAVYRRWFIDDIPMKIGIAAHVGGLVAGFILGQTFLKDYKRYPFKDGSGYFDFFTCLIFVGACIIFNIVYDGYPSEDYS